MAHYTGPRRRIVRRLGTPLHGLTRQTADERSYPPGQHGPVQAMRRQRVSEYAVRLEEKQKLRYYVRERSQAHPLVAAGAASGPEIALPGYLARDEDGFGGRVVTTPMRPDAPIDLSESLVIEYYAR